MRISELDCYLVGGAVRDQLLGIEGSDKDWVVVGATQELMLSLGFRPVGKDFPVFLHPQSHEEYALARTERKIGKGYKGFEVDTSNNVSLENDLYRRDITINAMALDSNDNLIDPYAGQEDLDNGVLRHVSGHFVEDPLRVLRVARFSARFYTRGFIIHDSTLELMREITDSGELAYLKAERVWQEVESAIGCPNPAVFFKTLKYCGALELLFPEIECLFAEDSASRYAIDSLDLVTGLTDDQHVRFSMLAYLIRHCGTDNDEADEAAAVTAFCKRLKTPRRYHAIALQIARFADRVMSVGEASAAETAETVLALNGIRDPEKYERFLNACTVVLSVANQNPKKVEQAVSLYRECCERMKSADVKNLANRFQGNELREKIRAAYIDQVSGLLEK